jgi:queuine tRNA-ribosyltransferase
MLGPVLLSLHNVAFYCRLLAEVQLAIQEQRYAEFQQVSLARWNATL